MSKQFFENSAEWSTKLTPLLLTDESFSSSDVGQRLFAKIQNLYQSSLVDGDSIRRRLVQEKKIHLAGIAQQEELHLTALNAFCEHGTYALPSVPLPINSSPGRGGGLMVSATDHPMLFEHILLDTRFFRSNGPALEEIIKRQGVVSIDVNFVYEYLDFLQTLGQTFKVSPELFDSLTDLVAKRAACSIAFGQAPLGVTPNALFLSEHGQETNVVNIQLDVFDAKTERKVNLTEKIPLEPGENVWIISPGLNFLPELRAIAQLADFNFFLYEENPFQEAVLRKTVGYLGMQNIVINPQTSAGREFLGPTGLILMPRAYVTGESEMDTFLREGSGSLKPGGKLIVFNSVNEEGDQQIASEILESLIARNGFTITTKRLVEHTSPAPKHTPRAILLQMKGRDLVEHMTTAIVSRISRNEFILAAPTDLSH